MMFFGLCLFLFWLVLVHSCLTFKSIISLASVQIYIQIVTLCNYNNNNNVRKQIHMAFGHGLFNK